uniref:Secreted protein n=1 Tax=Ascaris lumbricoides TaxID=6252 RepID=A0A0M3HMU7_ASCLU
MMLLTCYFRGDFMYSFCPYGMIEFTFICAEKHSTEKRKEEQPVTKAGNGFLKTFNMITYSTRIVCVLSVEDTGQTTNICRSHELFSGDLFVFVDSQRLLFLIFDVFLTFFISMVKVDVAPFHL